MTSMRPVAGGLRCRPPPANKGAALLVMLFLILAAFSTIIVTQLSKAGLELQKQKKTLEAMAQAKQALVAWSVLQGDLGSDSKNRQRPGTLPCPAFDDLGNTGSSCALASATMPTVGRLPWKELGIDALRDANGELLWYAVSNDFRRPGLTNAPINSDSKGTLLLFSADGTTTLTPTGRELAAIIFSSGPPLPGQSRSATNLATDYLDRGKDRNNKDWDNSAAAGPFIAGPVVDSQGDLIVNDIAIGISANELIAAIENRALNEAQKGLENYRQTNGMYPNPAKSNGPNCASKRSNIADTNTCDHDTSVCFGRFPEDIPVPSTWFQQNAWGRLLTYALSDASAGCTSTLKVDGIAKPYVLIAPGAALGVQTRPSSNLADYLEDSENKDAWNSDPDFSMPTSISNDQLRSLP